MRSFTFFYIILFITFLLPTCLFAQPTTFTSVFYDLSEDFSGSGVVQVSDSTYYIAGENNYSALLIRMDPYGYNLWEKRYILPGKSSFLTRIFQTHDDQFITIGSTNYDSPDGDILCMKLDENGDTIWSRSIDFGSSEYGTFIKETNDHGFIISGTGWISGSGETQMLVVKLDSIGDMQWARTLRTDTNCFAHSVTEVPDSGFYVIGGTRKNTYEWDTKALLVKLTPEGELSWAKKLTCVFNHMEGFDVVPSGSGLLCLLERSLLVKTDFSGNVEWGKRIGWGSGDLFYGHAQKAKLHPTDDQGFVFVITGQFGSLFKLDSIGTVEWSDELYVESADVIPTLDNGYLVIGNGPLWGVAMAPGWNQQIGMLKTDSLGLTESCMYPSWIQSDTITIYSNPVSIISGTGGVITDEHPEVSDASALHYDGCVAMSGSIDDGLTETRHLLVSPNPTTGIFQIQLEPDGEELSELIIYNSTGKIVWRSQTWIRLPASLDLSFLPDGIYLIQASGNKQRYSTKIMISK